ncbi:cilia- and flagella-associated protein 251-like [Halichondria panicea]|uniref:cilia- and flagella-associated protein 251-like n=1 Tax=Halichondria panicea TaxID=6063 RepID=UPI00312BC9ED
MATQEDVPADRAIKESSSSDVHKREECKDAPLSNHPLSLCWSYGFNSSLPVHNVSEGTRKMVFYVSSHVGVLLDISDNTQMLLQGHAHSIVATAVSGNKRWIVTADIGPNSTLIVWDSYTGVPVCTLFDGLGEGTTSVALSEDAKYLATLSADTPQVVCVWDWSSGCEGPLCTTSLSVDSGPQDHLVFHPSDNQQLVSNSEDSVVFYTWAGDKMRATSTLVSDKDFNKSTGELTQSVFIPGTDRGITGTSEGCAVVWGPRPNQEGCGRRPEKLMKLLDCPVTVVTTVNSFVVTGDVSGRIKFFDSSLKLLHWYDSSEQYGHLVSISFAHQPPKLSDNHQYPGDATMSGGPFLVPDFSTSSSTATITHTTANGSLIQSVLDEHADCVSALSTHPSLPRLAVASTKLKLWDYTTRQVVAARHFKEGVEIQCITFDPSGDIIGVGFSDGGVVLLDALTLHSLQTDPWHYSRDCVSFITFSHDSTYLATADADCCVSVYVCGEGGRWSFLAKHRSHHKPIVGLLFGVQLDSTLPRLLSLGQDRHIVEYDLAGSSQDDLIIHSIERVEQSATPTSLIWYPPLVKESFILLSNDEYKLKLFNSTTKMCRQTLLGPAFETPITRQLLLPGMVVRGSEGEEVRRYLAYTTQDKVGLLLLPHDGNPHNTSCLLAHSGNVTDLTSSHDGSYLFTAGGHDHTVHMWTVNTGALEALSQLGGAGLEPFYSLLEGGREGGFFKELEEFFYYAQIRSQSVETTGEREVSCTVPVEQLPDIMRAVGYYPSEEQIENMVNEVKFSNYVSSKVFKTQIDLGDTLKLYINHRPAFGLSPGQFLEAFKALGQRSGGECTVDRTKLLELLQEKGEHLTETELVEYLMTLLGATSNPEVEGAFTAEPGDVLAEIPNTLTATLFAEELLGLAT